MMKPDHQTFARAVSTSVLGLAIQMVMGLALLIYAFIAKDHPAMSGATFVLLGSIVWLVLAILFDQHRRERLEELEEASILGDGASGSGGGGRSASVFGESAQELRVAHRRLAWMHRVLVPLASLVYALSLAGAGVGFFLKHRARVDERFTSDHLGWSIAIGLFLAVPCFAFARYVAGMAKGTGGPGGSSKDSATNGWGNLRGGAGAAVSAALVGATLGIAHFAANFGLDFFARILHVAYPIAMMVLAAEVIFNFLLGLYRPRGSTEVPRPAMDSRLLSFVAAPDRLAQSIGDALNYQFGFNVTESWFYQLVSRWLASLVLVGALVVWLMTGLAIVQPNQQGLVLRFGRPITETLGPGLYRKAPWPIDVLETIDATTIRPVQLASETPKVRNSILWTNDHGVPEMYFPVQPTADAATPGSAEAAPAPASAPAPATDAKASADGVATKSDASAGDGPSTEPASGQVTGQAVEQVRDVALVAAEIPMYYTVHDYAKFRNLVTPEHRDAFLRALGRRVALEYLAAQPVDAVLGESRPTIAQELTTRINKRLESMNDGQGAGVTVRYVALVGVHPPRETAEMFESVVQATQTRAANIEAAQSFAEGELIRVAGSVDRGRQIVSLIDRIQALSAQTRTPEQDKQLAALELEAVQLIGSGNGSAADALTQAKAQRWTLHMNARVPAERYEAQLAAYRAAPKIYQAQLYFQTLSEVLSKARVYIVADESGRLEMRVNAEDSAVGNMLFDAPKALGENK